MPATLCSDCRHTNSGKYTINGLDYFAGKNRKLGLLIYDPNAQFDVPEDKIRLFKIDQQQSGTFLKEVIRTKLTKCTENELRIIRDEVEKYSIIRKNQRVAHCYYCKKHLDSVDFSICKECKWIRCSWNACGCHYRGHRHEDD